MTKEQAIHNFWNSFGVPAYDENTVPDDAVLPYITYEVAVDDFGHTVISATNIWDKSTSWNGVTSILELVTNELGLGGTTRRYDGGLMWIMRGTPFARRVPDDNQNIRHISINIETEFISEV